MTNSETLVEKMLEDAIGGAILELRVPFELRLPMFKAELQKLCVMAGVTLEHAEDGALVVVDAYNQTQSANLFETL